MEQFGDNPPVDGVIGYIESNGQPGFQNDEAVYVDDFIEPGVIVHTLCYNCTCEEEIECQQNICEPCNEDEEEVYVDDECCPQCIPKQDKCQLRYEEKKIVFKNENGNQCETKSAIPISYCAGACDSYDSSVIYNMNGEPVLHNHECKCCTGEGELVEQNVDCVKDGKQKIKIKMYTSCGCNQCEGEDKSAKKSPTVTKRSKSSNNDPTVPEEYKNEKNTQPKMVATKQQDDIKTDDLFYKSGLVQFAEIEPKKGQDALDKSGGYYELNEDSTYLLVLLDIDQQVEEISFVTKGDGEVSLEVTDEDNSYMVKEKNISEGTHSYSAKSGIARDLVLTLSKDEESCRISKLRIKYKQEN